MGPPSSARKGYVLQRMLNACRHCPECGADTWFTNKRSRHGSAQQVNVAGRVMSARRAMWIASGRSVKPGQRVTSRCKNPDCINPAMLLATNAGKVLELAYDHGRRDRIAAAAHLVRLRQAKARITADQALQIMRDERVAEQIAPEFGISAAYVNQIKRGQARAAIGNPWAGLGAR